LWDKDRQAACGTDREALTFFNIGDELLKVCLTLFFISIALVGNAKSEMVFPEKYWVVVTPESQEIDSAKLDDAIKYLESQCGKDGVKETVVIRNGYMIWKGSDIARTHNIWSITKAFTSTVLGLLIDDGKCTLDSHAKDFVPSLSKVFPEITLHHFNTMTSGYRAVKGKSKNDFDDSLHPFKPGPKPLFPPGTKFAYWNDEANMLGYILTRIAKEPMYSLFKRRIADPIGIPSNRWEWRNWGNFGGLIVNGGAGNREHGVYMSARDLARFGHLFLNRGNWNGKQLISSEWVDIATKNHVPADIDKYTGIDYRGFYGYNWQVNENLLMPDAPKGTFFRTGYPHNIIFVIPEWNMVIVRLGIDKSPESRFKMWNNVFKMIGESFLP